MIDDDAYVLCVMCYVLHVCMCYVLHVCMCYVLHVCMCYVLHVCMCYVLHVCMCYVLHVCMFASPYYAVRVEVLVARIRLLTRINHQAGKWWRWWW